MNQTTLPIEIKRKLHRGVVIPALPLALDKHRKVDVRRQKALMRYYLASGAGGVAVGVHSTQFEIRLPEFNMFRDILSIAQDEFDKYEAETKVTPIRIAGVIGSTEQASHEAELACKHGYHAALLGLASFAKADNQDIITHCQAIAKIIPIIGFYLQPAVGGRKLDVDFWREFSKIDNVVAIKMAPFNRYDTLDVVRGVVESGRADDIALYTGNDDNILIDLLSEYVIPVGDQIIKKRIVGGLLGHWAVWTRKAVELLEGVQNGQFNTDINKTLTLAHQITDCNAAFFDAAHGFAGCIVGLHEVLRRQGLLEGLWVLKEEETLSPGQIEEINRVYTAYPHLNDDEFVAENLDHWLSE